MNQRTASPDAGEIIVCYKIEVEVGHGDIRVDVRIISATNKDLEGGKRKSFPVPSECHPDRLLFEGAKGRYPLLANHFLKNMED
jgi:hypothetical protein